jgi:hypothetical protein
MRTIWIFTLQDGREIDRQISPMLSCFRAAQIGRQRQDRRTELNPFLSWGSLGARLGLVEQLKVQFEVFAA